MTDFQNDAYLSDDLMRIKQWAREVLFKKVKFLYRGKAELVSTGPEEKRGRVYKEFEKQCMNNLPGVIASQAKGAEYKEIYVKYLWDCATKKNVISNALCIRKGCIYTVMQSRFEDLCHICRVNDLIFPAMESFEERVNNPGNYYIFYDNFLRAAVGEEAWKSQVGVGNEKRRSGRRSVTSNSSNTSTSSRLSSPIDEAFALIMLKNNYWAWMQHAKGKWENDAKPLLTDYDDECLLSNHLTLAAHALNGAIIDLTTDENREEDDNHVIWRPKDDATEEAKQRYRMAETDLHAEISRFRSQVSSSKEHIAVTANLKALSEEDNSSKREVKRRRMERELKPFLNKRDKNEKAFKGYSERTYLDMFNLKEDIKKERALYKRYDKAYRQCYRMLRGGEKEPVLNYTQEEILTDEQHRKLFDDDESDGSVVSEMDDSSNDTHQLGMMEHNESVVRIVGI